MRHLKYYVSSDSCPLILYEFTQHFGPNDEDSMRLLARLLMRALIEISVLLLMEGSMRLFIKISMPLLTCLLAGLFDVSFAPITFRTAIPDFDLLSYPPQKNSICPENRFSDYLFLSEI